jgi:hypothetical protein
MSRQEIDGKTVLDSAELFVKIANMTEKNKKKNKNG